MEILLGNYKEKITIPAWFDRSKKSIETIQKRVFFYVIQELPEAKRKYLNSLGDGDDYHNYFKYGYKSTNTIWGSFKFVEES
jgi:hypothetical protein